MQAAIYIHVIDWVGRTLQRLDKTLAASYHRYEAATQRLLKTLTPRLIAAS